ncbi:hypothetical protein FO519_005566 [Halicephalobus sp. NKZ332]|nr:hypothetical protein FO519_005566 [Halicephalobus sp. NKZ332]
MKFALRIFFILAAMVAVNEACFGGLGGLGSLGLGAPLGGGNCCPSSGSSCGSRPLCSNAQYGYSYIPPPVALPSVPSAGYIQPLPASPPGYPYERKN